MPIPRLHKETSLFNRTRTFSSTFKVLADSITSLVKGTETYTDPVTGETKTNTFGTLLQQTANNVLIKATKSASTAAAGGQAIIESLINVAPEGIKIAADRVDIEGAVIFKSGRLSKVVTSSQTQWYSSTSPSQLSGGSWVTTQPNVAAGRYLWERTLYNYSNNTQEYRPSENGVCVTAPTDIAKTVSSVDVEYAQGTSATTAPSLGWSTNAPTIAAGKYLWTRTKTVLKDNTTSYTKATCVSGDNGKLVAAVKEQYYLSTSATECKGGSWVDTCPAWQSGRAIWTRTHMTYSDGTTGATTATLATALNDANQKANVTITGVDVEYADSTSQTTAPTSGWSTTAPAWQEGHFIWQRTKTVTPSGTSYSTPTCISGRDGVDGKDGKNGTNGTNGVSAYVYAINANPAALVRAENGTLSPTQVAFSATRAQGTGNPSAYSGRFIISEFDGSNWSNKYTSSANESSKSYSPTSTARVVRCSLYLAGGTSTLLDTQSVPIASNGATGAKGANGVGIKSIVEQYYLSTSNTSQTGGSWVTAPPAYAKGKYYWTRSKITWTDNNETFTDPVLANDVTSIAEIANASVKKATQLWFTKSDDTAPAKPTSNVTSASTAGNGWRVIVPVYNASYPNYFYCWQYEQMDGTFTWSDVVHDRTATETFGKIRGGLARSQLIYRNAPAGTNTMSPNTTWVTETGDVQGAWTTKRPTYDSEYPVLFTATQSQTVGQQATGSACSCTTPLKDDTLTKIDGGHITTGTIDASKVAVTNIDASNINTGTLRADVIRTDSITIDKLASNIRYVLNRDTACRGVCSTNATSSTKLVNCENFKTTEGATITVYNSTAQTYAGTLQLAVLGSNDNLYTSKYVYVDGSMTSESNQLLWAAGSSLTLIYHSGHWEVADSPGTWEGGECSVSSGTTAKTASAAQCVIYRGASVKVRMSHENTATTAKLNVQSLGTKSIYFGNTTTAPTKSNGYSWKASSLVEFVFDGQYWRTGSKTYIDGGDIVTGTIDAKRIDTNSLKADIIEAIEIKGDQIKGGTIQGVQIISSGLMPNSASRRGYTRLEGGALYFGGQNPSGSSTDDYAGIGASGGYYIYGASGDGVAMTSGKFPTASMVETFSAVFTTNSGAALYHHDSNNATTAISVSSKKIYFCIDGAVMAYIDKDGFH